MKYYIGHDHQLHSHPERSLLAAVLVVATLCAPGGGGGVQCVATTKTATTRLPTKGSADTVLSLVHNVR